MTCPFRENHSLRQLPCHWVTHSKNSNIRVCDVCRNHYDMRYVAVCSPGFLAFVLLVLATAIFVISVS